MKDNVFSDPEDRLNKLKQTQREAIDKVNEKDANSLNRELFEMEGFTATPRYEKYVKIVVLILALLTPIIVYLLFQL